MANYGKPDFWALKARQEAYPARSVYKLREIDGKFALLPSPGGRAPSPAPFRVLDLGAAPGSWSLYVLRTLKARGFLNGGDTGRAFLAAADLVPLSRQYDRGLFEGDHFFFIRGDITGEETRGALLAKGPYRLLLSDAAPATTGSRQIDTLRSLDLAEAVLGYAETALEPGGNMAVKVFQGGDTAALLKRIRELFKAGRSFKPQACRRESFETYYIGLDKK
jgi:23S rRNA (uridine2552-2'-O)-methyltransferase